MAARSLRVFCGLAVVLGLIWVIPAAAQGAAPSLESGQVGGIVPPRGPLKPMNALGGGNLSYHGGPVQHANTTYAIYWQPSGYSFGGNSAGYESTLNQFLGDVAHDSGSHGNVYATTPQYFDTVGGGYNWADYASTFAGSAVATNAFPGGGCSDPSTHAYPVCLTQVQEVNEIYSVITAHGWPINSSTEYFLFTPQNVTSCAGSGGNSNCAYTEYCAYHTYFTVGGVPVTWANHPWTSGMSECDAGQHPNGSDADSTINVLSHEHNETITDPLLNAWIDSAGYENGDKCAWIFGGTSGTPGAEYNQTINSHHYYVQQEWDNSGSQCVQTYTPPTPTVTSLGAASGHPGDTVTISGTGFVSPRAVKFNGASAAYTINSATQLTATVPADATPGPVSVVTPGGTAVSSASFGIGDSPTIASLAPTSGSVGSLVFINGTNLGTATSISFHGVAASWFQVVSATKLQAIVPAGATTGPVSVVNPDGTATSASDFTVVTVPAPVVTSFSPAKGTIGTKVTITGTNFTGAMAVRFGGVITTPTSVTATKLTAVVPAGALSGSIQVNTPGGPGASAGWFWLTPSIASFTPAGGIVGTHVTITGAGFTGATLVKFNGLSVSAFTIVDDHTITATVAPGTATGLVSVTTPGGTATSKDRFTDYRIASLTPAKGDVGTHITLAGTGFTGATAVAVNGTNVASFTVTGDTKITAVVAAGTTTGPITVTTPHGTLTTSASFWMIPHVASFSPAPATAGSTVTILGSGLTGTTAVKFNTTAATSFTVVSDTMITATIAAKTASGFVFVTTPGGTAKSAQALVVATVTSFSATRGVPGTKVTITGVGFTGATAVKFGGVNAAFTVVSDSKITAFVPVGGITGPLTVATTAGLATSTTAFTVV